MTFKTLHDWLFNTNSSWPPINEHSSKQIGIFKILQTNETKHPLNIYFEPIPEHFLLSAGESVDISLEVEFDKFSLEVVTNQDAITYYVDHSDYDVSFKPSARIDLT